VQIGIVAYDDTEDAANINERSLQTIIILMAADLLPIDMLPRDKRKRPQRFTSKKSGAKIGQKDKESWLNQPAFSFGNLSAVSPTGIAARVSSSTCSEVVQPHQALHYEFGFASISDLH
jgi:hypothetical protein